MNDEQKYYVVFTGRFAPDIDRAVVMQDSIRRLANYLLSNNPQLLFDKNTYEFVQSGKLSEFNGDIVRLTTALEQSMLKRLAVNASADTPTLENS